VQAGGPFLFRKQVVPKIITRIERPDATLVERFRHVRMDQIIKALHPSQLLDSAIKPLAQRDCHILGPAVTVSGADANSLTGILAAGVAQAGDVIVMAAGNPRGYAWGGGQTLSADHVGCAGVVVDGPVIDADAILQRTTPVFCRGSTLHKGTQEELGSINVPVVCGGVTIHPGDLVIGTLDGVCVIPREQAPGMIDQVEQDSARIEANIAKLKATKSTIFALRGGRSITKDLDIDWID